ncbi:MAG: hypothetical protein H6636_12565 [Anaerolineales bacterium]|nr:hypothetical protein [Anaerolineales bacterium]
MFQKFHNRFDKYKTLHVAPRQYSGHELLHHLGLRPEAPVLVIQEDDARWRDERLGKIVCEEMARAAVAFGVSIVDQGIDVGLPGLLNTVLRERHHPGVFIGVASTTFELQPQQPTDAPGIRLGDAHTHFVLVEGNGVGIELPTMRALVHALAEKTFYMLISVRGGKALEEDENSERDPQKTSHYQGFTSSVTGISLQLRLSETPQKVSREDFFSLNDLYAEPEKPANRIRHYMRTFMEIK